MFVSGLSLTSWKRSDPASLGKAQGGVGLGRGLDEGQGRANLPTEELVPLAASHNS